MSSKQSLIAILPSAVPEDKNFFKSNDGKEYMSCTIGGFKCTTSSDYYKRKLIECIEQNKPVASVVCVGYSNKGYINLFVEVVRV